VDKSDEVGRWVGGQYCEGKQGVLDGEGGYSSFQGVSVSGGTCGVEIRKDILFQAME
jgi:hypothetical protein